MQLKYYRKTLMNKIHFDYYSVTLLIQQKGNFNFQFVNIRTKLIYAHIFNLVFAKLNLRSGNLSFMTAYIIGMEPVSLILLSVCLH